MPLNASSYSQHSAPLIGLWYATLCPSTDHGHSYTWLIITSRRFYPTSLTHNVTSWGIKHPTEVELKSTHCHSLNGWPTPSYWMKMHHGFYWYPQYKSSCRKGWGAAEAAASPVTMAVMTGDIWHWPRDGRGRQSPSHWLAHVWGEEMWRVRFKDRFID